MTLHEILSQQVRAWAERAKEEYPDSRVKWCTDQITPSNIRRRIAIVRESPNSERCAGFFIVMFDSNVDGTAKNWAVIEDSVVFDPPIAADEIPNFILRELFKAGLAGVEGVLGATFKGGSEFVKHYRDVDDLAWDLAKLE